jgi:hypothetical protein
MENELDSRYRAALSLSRCIPTIKRVKMHSVLTDMTSSTESPYRTSLSLDQLQNQLLYDFRYLSTALSR